MKRIIFLFALALAQITFAQEEVVEKSYAFKGQELDIDVELGTEIAVKSWDKNEISVKIKYEVNGGESNDAVTVDIDDYSDRLSLDIRVSERKMRRAEGFCCKGSKSTYWDGDSRSQSCIDMLVEVMIPASADVRIKSVISDVIIEGMKGDVEVETVTGAIDLAWDESMGAEVSMKTTTGDLYTNFDLDRKRSRGLPLISSHNVEGTFKDGAREVFLKTVTSDIYFRKPGT